MIKLEVFEAKNECFSSPVVLNLYDFLWNIKEDIWSPRNVSKHLLLCLAEESNAGLMIMMPEGSVVGRSTVPLRRRCGVEHPVLRSEMKC